MIFFWILWIFNALVSCVPIYFFFAGLADGSITSRNIGLWFMILLVVALVLIGTILLKAANQLALAKVILVIAGIPGVLILLYFLIIFTTHPDFK